MKKSKIEGLRSNLKIWKVPKIFLNKYFFTSFVFVIWMAFFDQNNLLVQLERSRELKDAASKKDYYEAETIKTKLLLDQLLTDKNSLEKFAREKYYMKKQNEDVFVIIEK